LVESDLLLEQLYFVSSIMCLLFQGLASFGLSDNVPCSGLGTFNVGLEFFGLGDPPVDVGRDFLAQAADICLFAIHQIQATDQVFEAAYLDFISGLLQIG
jgi:hypothetical protein